MNLQSPLNPRAAAMSRALVALLQERESVSPEDLIARGFTRREIEAFRDDAVASAARRYDAREHRPSPRRRRAAAQDEGPR